MRKEKEQKKRKKKSVVTFGCGLWIMMDMATEWK